ncbi:MAG: hypothetical protein IT282_15455 [Bacteroidetes bacterium]|nr:hypothetical protein [Bacteroidota bacterium]
MKPRIVRTISLLLCMIVYSAGAGIPDAREKSGPSKPLIRDLRYIYGRYEVPVTNDGRFGWDPSYNVPGGGRWPRGTNEGYIFGAGIWVGARIDSTKRVAVGYNPTNIQTEFVPGAPPNEPGSTDPSKVVYVSTDYPDASLPDWPRGTDESGSPITVSQMDSWSQCNDLDVTRQFENGKPLGVLLTTETFSWSSSFRDVQDIAFIRYTVKNINPEGKAWTDAYLGFAMDADIGDPTNDLTGCFKDLNIGFTYSGANLTSLEEDLDHPPGYVGIKYLEGPAKDPVTGAAKMTTFVKWASELNPNTDDMRYDLMANGTYDSVDTEPADKRMLISSGPFTLALGDSVQLVVAIIFAWPEWYFNPALKGQLERYADHLKLVAANAQYIFDNAYRFPQPPDLPQLTIAPDDRKLVVLWDDASEQSIEQALSLPNSSDPQDFEGYRLWKSLSGAEGTWVLLDECDKVNADDAGKPIGKNTGLSHAYVDRNLTNGKTYFYAVTAYDKGEYQPLHFGDSAYQVVPPLETGKIFGINLKAESPNVLPSNYTVPGFRDLSVSAADGEQMDFGVVPNFHVRDSVQSKRFKVHFGSPRGIRIDLEEAIQGPDIFVVDAASGDTLSTSFNFPITDPPSTVESDLFNGMTLDFTGPSLVSNTIDSVYFARAKSQVHVRALTDPAKDYLAPQSSILRTPPLSFFFQPHVYLVEFAANDEVNVFDKTTGEKLSFELRTLGRDYAVATYLRQVLTVDPTTHDTTWAWANNPQGFKRRKYSPGNGYKIYVPGAFVFIEDIGGEIVPGDSLYIQLSGRSAPRSGDIVEFVTEGSTLNYQADLSVVKVVPNPYLVRAGWDLDNDYQRLQFINLPTECVIAIYTIAGDLVKTITHAEPYRSGFDKATRGTAYWNLQTENNQKVSTGVYVFRITSPFGESVGRFAIVR